MTTDTHLTTKLGQQVNILPGPIPNRAYISVGFRPWESDYLGDFTISIRKDKAFEFAKKLKALINEYEV